MPVTLESVIVPVSVLILGFCSVYLFPHVYGKISRSRLAGRCQSARALVLTYDDGPGAVLTPKLVGLLRRHGVKATFFCLGNSAEAKPDSMDLLKSEGHELGCHSYGHLHAWKTNPLKAVRDINRGYDSLSRWFTRDAMFRPPHGKLVLHTWLALAARRSKIVWWTHDSGDTWHSGPPSADDFAQSVIRSGGGVVLMHDFDRAAGPTGASRESYVLKATEALITGARNAGLEIKTLGELLNTRSA